MNYIWEISEITARRPAADRAQALPKEEQSLAYEDQIRQMLLGRAFVGAERICEIVRLFFRGDGDVTLHAMCLVRVVRGGRLVASSADTLAPAIDIQSVTLGDLRWDRGFSAYDFSMKGFLEHTARGVVDGVRIAPWGDMVLSLDNATEIHILTDTTLDWREQWRVFREGSPERAEHIVRSASGFGME